ncbi:hypothetical protein HDU93_009272 [Gonapodya sp. JEL0774]|nr:hypothetical protein HDU93_009272 [Gonapodya sp. JEL0774]
MDAHLIEAVESENTQEVRRLLHLGANPCARKTVSLQRRVRTPEQQIIHTRTFLSESALMLAIVNDFADVVALLLDHGADPNAEQSWIVGGFCNDQTLKTTLGWSRYTFSSALALAVGCWHQCTESWPDGRTTTYRALFGQRVPINTPGSHVVSIQSQAIETDQALQGHTVRLKGFTLERSPMSSAAESRPDASHGVSVAKTVHTGSSADNTINCDAATLSTMHSASTDETV